MTGPAETAYQAAEQIRTLNHQTLNETLPAPQISRVVAELAALVDMLPQAFEQLAHQVERRRAEDEIRMDTGEDPDAVVPEVVAALREAAALCAFANRVHWGDPAGPLSAAVHAAAAPLFSMGAPNHSEDDLSPAESA